MGKPCILAWETLFEQHKELIDSALFFLLPPTFTSSCRRQEDVLVLWSPKPLHRASFGSPFLAVQYIYFLQILQFTRKVKELLLTEHQWSSSVRCAQKRRMSYLIPGPAHAPVIFRVGGSGCAVSLCTTFTASIEFVLKIKQIWFLFKQKTENTSSVCWGKKQNKRA